MVKIPFFWVDAFAKKPFQGNPAAVCLICNKEAWNKEKLQNIAREINLSETTFLFKMESTHNNKFKIRWFTPEVEVPLCGHGTLAAAGVLFKNNICKTDMVYFTSLSGQLTAKRACNSKEKNEQNNEKQVSVILDFPINIPNEQIVLSEEVFKYLGLNKEDVVMSCCSISAKMIIVQVNNERIIKKITPNFQSLKSVSLPFGANGLIITSKSNKPGIDFVSRYFGPWEGINEDPATGSAHTVLSPYWKNILKKNEYSACQESSRGGYLNTTIIDNERVLLEGIVHILIEGTLFI